MEFIEYVGFFLTILLAKIANERLKMLASLLFDLQTSVRGKNGVEFDQESAGHGPRHVTHLFALLLAEIAKGEGSKWGRILPGIH